MCLTKIKENLNLQDEITGVLAIQIKNILLL